MEYSQLYRSGNSNRAEFLFIGGGPAGPHAEARTVRLLPAGGRAGDSAGYPLNLSDTTLCLVMARDE